MIMKKIMFVCTGNICRSPMGHYYLQKLVNDAGLENDYLISSCGTYANNGESSTINAIESMKKYGVDMNKHRATNIANTDIEDYDLVICLTLTHKASVLEYSPKLKGKVLINSIGTTIGSHTGPGTVALFFWGKERED